MRDLTELPKVHLHVHLESTVRPSTLSKLGLTTIDIPTFDGFRAFANYNTVIRECLRRPEDFFTMALEFCEDEAAQGTRYAEVMFTAAAHGERLGDLPMPLSSVLEGLAEGQRNYDIECRVLLDHSRRRSVERAQRTVELATKHDEVIGVGLAGEEAYPATPFAEVFAAAREAGLHVVHHAGETEGPASIREVLDHTERLGHGIRVLDDPALVTEVRDRGIPLEVCPSSNLALGLVPSLDAHPLPRLRDAGLIITLNTDIPNVTGTTLTEEFRRARDIFGYDDATLAELNHAAIDASFAPDATKATLHRDTDAWLA